MLKPDQLTDQSEQHLNRIIEDRFQRLSFFLTHKNTQGGSIRKVFVPRCAVHLAEAYFPTKRAFIWWVCKEWIRDNYRLFHIGLWFFWQVKVLKKTDEEIDELIDRKFDR